MPRPRVRRKPGKPPAAKSGETGGRKLYALPSVQPPAAGPTIVGVGASAGGLEAFSTLLQSLSPNPGVVIVFVQHLAPQHESALVSLLSGQTAMPVVQATHGLNVEPNHVYVIPPNAQMIIVGRTLHLGARPDDRSQYTPVDTFFASLADAAGPRAIGIILSGTASDGALGVREIKAAGGVTMAQEPASAKYDGMPRAAIATGMVDLVFDPSAIGAKLVDLSRHAYLNGADKATSEFPASEDELHEIFDLLRPVSGIDFRHYKLPTIKRRLFRRMALHRLNDVGQYVQLLRGDAAELRSLYQDLLIHVTRFFREPESFEALARAVFPELVKGRGPGQPIRAWVSGCATGEEAYSLAIALVEFLQKNQLDMPVQIFATDVSETAIEQARAGVYPPNIEGDVGAERLRRFFTKHDGGHRVTKMIRDLCVFARQDLTKDPPFSRLDLILCRNVLIYMDTVLQRRLLSVFHYALNPHGYLVLGQAETVGAQVTLFSLVEKKYRVHRKRAVTLQPAMSFPREYHVPGVPVKKPQADAAGGEKALQSEVNRTIMERFAPPGVVVDSEMQIVQFRGQTGAFLEPAPGEANLNLLKMAKEGLLYGLRTTINAARKAREAVRKDGLQVRAGKGWKPVRLEVIPLAANGRTHFLVLFDDRTPGHAAARTKSEPPPPKADKREKKTRVEFLQRELAASREYLQSIIEELEAANEELQSANEEILSSNEELQSTNEELDTAKEELQSTNEELNTVNEELHGRNEELNQLNSDLVNLLGSVQIAIVIVSADLRVRRFTPMAEKVLNLIPTDTDRPIGHINPNIVGENLEQLIATCIDKIAPIEREVQDRQGRWYSLRIRPYRNAENRIDGAVVTLIDIDAPRRYEQQIRAAVTLAEQVLQASAQAFALLDSDLCVRSASSQFGELFSMSDQDRIRRRPLRDFARSDAGYETLRQFARGDGDAADHATLTLRPSNRDESITVDARSFPPFDGASGRMLLLTVAR